MRTHNVAFTCSIAALLTTIAACAPLTWLNAVTPTYGYTRTPDLAYADHPRQKLDVYVPARNSAPELKPVVIFFYGGSWQSGNRNDYRFIGEALTSQGFVVLVPDYRVYPEALFPEFLTDGARTIRWARDNVARFGGDPERIFIMGFSAGAHIAAMLALDRQYLKTVGMTPTQLRGVIGLAGPYDFLPLKSDTLKIVFGPESERWRSQPINFVDGRNPPALLMTGSADAVVNPDNTRRLAEKIKLKGGQVETVDYAELDHSDLLTRFAAPLRKDALLNAVAAFVRSH
jgi:acetyl esterase/lipase